MRDNGTLRDNGTIHQFLERCARAAINTSGELPDSRLEEILRAKREWIEGTLDTDTLFRRRKEIMTRFESYEATTDSVHVVLAATGPYPTIHDMDIILQVMFARGVTLTFSHANWTNEGDKK